MAHHGMSDLPFSERDISDASTLNVSSVSLKKIAESPVANIVESKEQVDDGVPPDGGFKAWSVVLGIFSCSMCTWGWINSVGVWEEYYQTHQLQSYSESTISWIISLETFFISILAPVFGKLYDIYGPRYILLGGSITHVLGLMLASVSKEYYQFLLTQGVLSSIGMSAVFVSSVSTLPQWFKQRRGAAMGIAYTGSSIGGVIFPIMINRLLPQVGFGWTVRIVAFMVLVLLVIANLTVRNRTLPHPQPPVTLKQFFSPLLERVFFLTAASNFLFTFGFYVPVGYIIVQAIAGGMSQDLANYLISILNAASLFGRIIPGYLADRYGKYNIFVIVSFATAILVLALWIPATSDTALILFAALYGFTSGGFISLGPGLAAQISPIDKIGIRQGLLFAVMAFGGLTTTPIAGAIVALDNGGFTGVKVFAGSMCLAGATLALLARGSAVGFGIFKKF